MTLEFDPVEHRYSVDGQTIPSVTQLLAPLYAEIFARIPREVLERKRAIGVAVHAATELIDEGALDESSIDEEIAGYLCAYEAFLLDESPCWTMSETRLWHPGLRFAGTLDRAGFIRGEPSIVDIKTVSELHAAVGLQLAGYDLLSADGLERPFRYALQLKPDGTYRLEPFTDPDDGRVFLSLLTTYHWRMKHGC